MKKEYRKPCVKRVMTVACDLMGAISGVQNTEGATQGGTEENGEDGFEAGAKAGASTWNVWD